MDEATVLPSVGGKGKEIKQANLLIEKVYSPFLSKFVGQEGFVTKAIVDMQTALSLRLVRMIEILEKLFDTTDDENNENKKNQPKPDKKKQKEETEKKWYKIIKGKWFEKAAGFLSKLVSVNFITMLLGFIIMLRMGLLQMVLPWLLEIVGGAIVSIIKAIPALLKFFFNLLWVTIPKLLKKIFKEIFKALGIENKALLAFGDMIAQILPMLAAIGFIWFKVGPLITSTITALGKFGGMLGKIGPMLFKLEMFFWNFVTKLMVGFSKFISIVSKVGKVLFSFGSKFISIAGKLGLAIGKLGLSVWTFVIKTLLPAMASFFSSMIAFIAPLLLAALPFIVIAGALALLFVYAEKISDFFDGLIEKFKSLSTGMKILVGVLALVFWPVSAIIALVYGLVKAFKFFKAEGFVNGLIKIKDAIFAWLSSLYESFLNMFSKIGDSIKSVWSSLVGWISGLWNGLKNIINSVWEGIKSGFMFVVDSIISGVKGYINLVSGLFSKLWSGITSAFNFVWDGIKSVGSKISGFFSSMFSPITDIAEDIGGYFSAITLPEFNFGEIATNLYNSVINVFTRMVNFIRNIPSMFVSAIKGISKVMSRFINWFVGLLKGMLNTLLSPFKSMFSGLGKITKPVIDAISPLLTSLSSFMGSIGNTLGRVFDKVKSAFDGMLNYLGNIIEFGPKWFVMGKEKKEKVYKIEKSLATDQGKLLERIATGEVKADAAGVRDVLTDDAIKMAQEYRTYAKKEGAGADSFKKWMADRAIATKEGVQNVYTDTITKSFKQGKAATAALNKFGIE
jgi:phage-related protein